MSTKCNPVRCSIHKRIGTYEAMLQNKWLSQDGKIRTMAVAEIRFLLDLSGLITELEKSSLCVENSRSKE